MDINLYQMDNTHPWNETLIETRHTAATPNCPQCLEHRLATVCSHLCLDDFQRLAKRRNLTEISV